MRYNITLFTFIQLFYTKKILIGQAYLFFPTLPPPQTSTTSDQWLVKKNFKFLGGRYILSKRVTFLIFIVVAILFLLYLRPNVSVTYDISDMIKWHGKKLEAVRILKHNAGGGELGDPFPIWFNLQVQNVTILDKPIEMIENHHGLLRRDDRILVRQLNNGDLDGTKKICPAGSCVVNVVMKKTWWSIFSGYEHLDGANVLFCVNPNYSNTQPQEKEEHLHAPAWYKPKEE